MYVRRNLVKYLQKIVNSYFSNWNKTRDTFCFPQKYAVLLWNAWAELWLSNIFMA